MSAATALTKQRRFRRLLAALVAPGGDAWWGPDATWDAAGAPVAWPSLRNVNAAPGGSGTTRGALAGVACPVFGGSGYYDATFSWGGPCVVLTIAEPTSVTGFPTVWRRLSGDDALLYFYSSNSAYTRGPAGAGEVGGINMFTLGSPGVYRSVLTGANSQLIREGGPTYTATINPVTSSNGVRIGSSLVGKIPTWALLSGANYAARAAVAAAAAKALIGA